MSLPYEKMYLIDEADYLQLKTGNALPLDDDDDVPALTFQLDEASKFGVSTGNIITKKRRT